MGKGECVLNQIVFAAGVLLFRRCAPTLGGGRGVPAASVGGTAHPAGAQRDGGGHHVGGQRVEPAAAGH